jgi:hypothetical protein
MGSRWSRWGVAACLGLALCVVSGCGGSDADTEGQAEVTPDMLSEARAQDAYFDSQKKESAPAKKKATESPAASPKGNSY